MSETANGVRGARPRVVVVGAGYAGVNVARGLDDVADVVLVDRKESFAHVVASLRALVQPAWLPSVFYPLERLLARGRFVHSAAVAVDSRRVALASGEELGADYLVLATGSTYPFPAKTDAITRDETFRRYETAHAALAAARRVVLMGAGPVGIELAGEISAVWPDTHVTIVDIADDLLAGGFKPELRAELRRQLDDLGVELVLGARLEAEPPTAPGEPGAFTVTSDDGRSISGDLWFRCHGVVPVSDYLAGDLLASRLATGEIETSATLQVPGHDRVFALGDASSADAKMAGRAGMQAGVVVANVRALIAGESELQSYQPLPPVIVVPLGPTGGAAQLPGSDDISGAEVASQIKGAALMVDRYAELFGMAERSLT